jgi:outer membrane protein assembly factor BamE (lipoprotein component of BamABCDE complex)
MRALCVVAMLGTPLAGCDDRKVADVLNAIKPDEWLLKDIKPGLSTVEDVRRQMGKPEIVWQNEDGSQRLEYPRGPNGTKTYMLDFDPDGRLLSIDQVLTADNIRRVRSGMSKDDVRRLLGKPTEIARYALKQEEVWSWHWVEGGYPSDAMFNAHFGTDGVVATTSRSEAPGNEKP